MGKYSFACIAAALLLLVCAATAFAGEKLGRCSADPYGEDSTANSYGKAGSPYSVDSINKPYGDYGSPYSSKSATNPYATNAPKLYDSAWSVRGAGRP
jgi:hypothetical protein